MYNFDEVINRRGTNCVKWDSVIETYKEEDLIPMWVADMDFKILPEISKSVEERAKHLTYGYTFPRRSFYENFIDWNRRRNSYEIRKEWMRLSVGVVPSIKAAIFALTEKDDKVLIQTPVYPPFYSSVKMLKRTLVTNPLHFDGEKYNIDFDDFEEKIRSGVKLFILCNPHNPVGRCWTEEELRKLADICYNYNVKIVSDEIHSDIIYKNFRHHVLNTVSEKARNISVICQAPSKTFNIAGLCLSCVIVENEVIRKQMWEAMYAIGTDTVNLFGLTAAETAYNQGEIWVDEMVGYVEENAEFVCRYINENMPKVKAYKPQATYLMWLDFGKYDMTQAELMVKLVKEAKVVLNSGTDFGDEGKGYVRLNIGCPRSMVEESLARIKAAFDAAD